MVGYLAQIWRCRYFWWCLVRMDLRTRYRRSVLGLGWSLVHPIAMTAILWLVFHNLFGADHTYAASLLIGIAFWNYVTSATLTGCQCFFAAESYIRQYPSPLAIFPLRAALGAGFHFLMALLLGIGLAGYMIGSIDPLALLSLLPTLALLFAFSWAMALLGGIANVLFQDTEHLTAIGFQILFYATPIIYREKDQMLQSHNLQWLMHLNPLAHFLKLLREPILEGKVPSGDTFAMASATVAAVAGVAIFMLCKIQKRFVFHL